MKTLLIGLDNPHSRNPAHALLPMPDGATGSKIVGLIGDVVAGYRIADYLSDFARVNLYVGDHARSGRGATATDKLLGRLLMLLIREGGYSSVVLFGKRVQAAFDDFAALDGNTATCHLSERDFACSVYALPHPSGRNRWYNDADHRLYAARLLESLRENRS